MFFRARIFPIYITTAGCPYKFKKYILPTFGREMYKWGSDNR